MPELATVYFAGLVFCLALTVVFYFLRMQRRKKAKYECVQSNLRKVGLFWSENYEAAMNWEEGLDKADIDKLDQSSARLGAVLSLLSWAGALFLLVVMVSYRFLARSRKEIRLFSSPLATSPELSAPEILKLVEDLDLRNRRATPLGKMRTNGNR